MLLWTSSIWDRSETTLTAKGGQIISPTMQIFANLKGSKYQPKVGRQSKKTKNLSTKFVNNPSTVGEYLSLRSKQKDDSSSSKGQTKLK